MGFAAWETCINLLYAKDTHSKSYVSHITSFPLSCFSSSVSFSKNYHTVHFFSPPFNDFRLYQHAVSCTAIIITVQTFFTFWVN